MRVKVCDQEWAEMAKIRSIAVADPLKTLVKSIGGISKLDLDSAQNGQNRQYRDLRPFGLRKIPMQFTNVFSGKKSRFGPKWPNSTVSGSPTLWIAKNPYAIY